MEALKSKRETSKLIVSNEVIKIIEDFNSTVNNKLKEFSFKDASPITDNNIGIEIGKKHLLKIPLKQIEMDLFNSESLRDSVDDMINSCQDNAAAIFASNNLCNMKDIFVLPNTDYRTVALIVVENFRNNIEFVESFYRYIDQELSSTDIIIERKLTLDIDRDENIMLNFSTNIHATNNNLSSSFNNISKSCNYKKIELSNIKDLEKDITNFLKLINKES